MTHPGSGLLGSHSKESVSSGSSGIVGSGVGGSEEAGAGQEFSQSVRPPVCGSTDTMSARPSLVICDHAVSV